MRQCCILCTLVLVVTAGADEDLLQQARKSLAEAQVRARGAYEMGTKGDGEGSHRLMMEHATLIARAREQYETFYEQNPAHVAGGMEYASVLSMTDDADLAEEILLGVVALEPRNVPGWMALGRSQQAQGPGRAPDALESFRKALALNPEARDAAAVHAGIAALLQAVELNDLAMAECEKALELDPENVDARIALALLDLSVGRVREASEMIDALGRISQEADSKLVHGLGVAMAEFNFCRRLVPDNAENQLAYAKLLIRINRLGDSVYPLRRASELQPDNHVTWNLLGSVLQQIGSPEGALDAFTKSLSVNPDQARTREVADALRKRLGEVPPTQSPEAGPIE
jgi:tetratricopeptide (TPR) repeat protein